MSFEEFALLHTYMMTNHSWKNGFGYKSIFLFKYMNIDIDSRTGTIWRIVFRTCYNIPKQYEDKYTSQELVFRDEADEPIQLQLMRFISYLRG